MIPDYLMISYEFSLLIESEMNRRERANLNVRDGALSHPITWGRHCLEEVLSLLISEVGEWAIFQHHPL
jgi:hypothetical protein